MKTNLKATLFMCGLILCGLVSVGQSPKASATVIPIPASGNIAVDEGTTSPIVKVGGHYNRGQRAHRARNRNRFQNRNRIQNRPRVRNRNRIQNRPRVRNRNRIQNRPRVRNRNQRRFINRGPNRRVFAYRGNRHGPRFRSRRGRNKFYNNGFWYVAPFWLGAVYGNTYYDDGYYGGGTQQSYGDDDHVQWCRNRYRSYSPRTDTFRGYDGLNHRCRSPFNR